MKQRNPQTPEEWQEAVDLNVRGRHASRPAEAVLELRKIWQQRQPENPCKFGIWSEARPMWNGNFIDFTWRDAAAHEDGFIARVRTQNFEHIAVAAALLTEISALRSATLKKPATKEESHVTSETGSNRVGLTHAPEGAARHAKTA